MPRYQASTSNAAATITTATRQGPETRNFHQLLVSVVAD